MAADLPKHPVFTRVYQRSFDAYVDPKAMTLDAVMAALAVDPHEAEDAFDEFGVQGIPHSLDYFASRDLQSRGAYTAALQTLSQWITYFGDDDESAGLDMIVGYDGRLGLWCALQCVRKAVPFVGKNKSLAKESIQTVERWIKNPLDPKWMPGEWFKAPIGILRVELSKTIPMGMGRIWSVQEEAIGAVHILLIVAEMMSHGDSFSVEDADELVSQVSTTLAKEEARKSGRKYVGQYQRSLRATNLKELRQVIADACLSYPVTP